MAYMERHASNFAPVKAAVAANCTTPGEDSLAHFGAKTVNYKPHDVVYYEGDAAKRLYELAAGTIMLFKLLPDGRRQVVEIIRPGDIFGLSPEEEMDCTAETLTDATVYALDMRHVESSPELQKRLTRCLASQMQSLHEHAVLLGRKSAMERVASFLMYLVPNRGGPNCAGPASEDKDNCHVSLYMTRQEIADYLGLTIETVSRVISDMKRKGLIKTERPDRIEVNRVCNLCQLTGMH